MAVRYTHVVDTLRSEIGSGELSPGDRLPAEPKLAARFRVGLPTLRRALDVLQHEGLVEKRQGSGNYVRRPRERVLYGKELGTPCVVARDALRTSAVSRKPAVATGRIQKLMSVPNGTPLTEFTVLASDTDDDPCGLTRAYVRQGVLDEAQGVPAGLRSPWGDDLREQLLGAGVEVTRRVERVVARPVAPDETELLNVVPGTWVLEVERTSYDDAESVVEAAIMIMPCYRGQVVFSESTAA